MNVTLDVDSIEIAKGRLYTPLRVTLIGLSLSDLIEEITPETALEEIGAEAAIEYFGLENQEPLVRIDHD